MLQNKDEKIVEKMIRVMIIALVTAMLSALYISNVQAADVVLNMIQMPGTQPSEHSNLESSRFYTLSN